MKYTYHYYAIVQKIAGQTINLDGVIQFEHLINNYTRYTKMKKAICEMQEPYFDPNKLTICSLALLETVEEEDSEI